MANGSPSGAPQASCALPDEPYRSFVAEGASPGVIEHVSYSLFQRDKLAFCTSHSEQHGKPPSAEELAAFVRASLLPDRITAYQAEAETILQVFAENALTTASQEAEERHRQHFYSELKKVRPFWRNMVENMFANMAALALTALVVIAIYGTRISFVSLLGDIFGYDIKERPKSELNIQKSGGN